MAAPGWGPVVSALEELGVSGVEALGLDAAGALLTGAAGVQAGVDVPNDVAAGAVDVAAVAKDAEAGAKFVKLAEALAHSPVGAEVRAVLVKELPEIEAAAKQGPHALQKFLESPIGKKVIEGIQDGVKDAVKNAVTWAPVAAVGAAGVVAKDWVTAKYDEYFHHPEYSQNGSHWQSLSGKNFEGTVRDINPANHSVTIDCGRAGSFQIRNLDDNTMKTIQDDAKLGRVELKGGEHNTISVDAVPQAQHPSAGVHR